MKDNIISLDSICLDERECGCHIEWDRSDVIIVFCPLHDPDHVADLLAALERCQWGAGPIAGQRVCPQCGHGELDGHSPSCQIAAAIADAKEQG